MTYVSFAGALLISMLLLPPNVAWELAAVGFAVLLVQRNIEHHSLFGLGLITFAITALYPLWTLFLVAEGSSLDPLSSAYLSIGAVFWYLAPTAFLLVVVGAIRWTRSPRRTQ
ncbi:MAG: hypothetical protein HYS20_11360 [Rhodocyclales bacterium]|nr:hypothetical protein [Rhodocyclales bacterium]